MTQTVLILGARGKVGRHAKDAFSQAGWNVRLYDRKLGNMPAQATGADVIVNGLNPPDYHNWADIIPRITQQVIEAATITGATVIIPANVYNFGNSAGTWDETTPHRPQTRKGKIREILERSYEASGVQTILLRGGDFITPQDGGDDVMRLVVLKDIRKGKITLPGESTTMHAYCYLPDWARAAVLLAEKRDALGQFEDITFGGYNFTLQDLKAELEQALGHPLHISKFPWWALKLTSPFWELARELSEMRYLWDVPHELGTDKFNRLVPDFERTDLSTVMRASLPCNIDPNKAVPKQSAITV
ncbi:epimerase [Pacificibacter marinus]|uniref:epimerase n=1 Tax=Pacificibacter marinus TaxID=658057 RepID=UPI001C067272|nr:epimerase [Pacificibacter marinus]MBU2866096.1 epimerase [Pacificibacter marinus]